MYAHYSILGAFLQNIACSQYVPKLQQYCFPWTYVLPVSYYTRNAGSIQYVYKHFSSLWTCPCLAKHVFNTDESIKRNYTDSVFSFWYEEGTQ